MPKLLAFAGSTRRDSYNRKLIQVAAEAARAAGGRTRGRGRIRHATEPGGAPYACA